MATHPRISLITTVRNGAAFMERCLQSVAAQNYPNLDFIVLDAASTDGTQDIIERYHEHISYYRSQKDSGPYEALTHGCSVAKGDIIGFLMADDWLEPGALEAIAQMYAAKPHAKIFCFNMQEYGITPEGAIFKTRLFKDSPGERFSLVDGLYCQGMNRFYARALLTEKVLYRNDVYPIMADREFYIRLGLRKVEKAYADKALYNFLTHPGSNSTGGSVDKIIRMLEETCQLALDLLCLPGLDAAQQNNLRDWYVFNKLRSLYFHARAKHVSVLGKALGLILSYPLRTLKNVMQWKMPQSYRAIVNRPEASK